MENRVIGVIDSGVGGLSVLKELDDKLRNCTFIYLGDNHNAPYGSKTKRELLWLSLNNINLLKTMGARKIVVACNTLSVNLINELEYYSGVNCFGVYPPIESSMTKGETVLFCTPKTAEKYLQYKNLPVFAFPDLALDIENNIFNLNNVDIFDHLIHSRVYNLTLKNKSREEFVRFFATKRVILGCTHYVLIKNQIFNHLKPPIITSGNFLTVNCISKTLKSSVIYKQNKVLFVGKNAKNNCQFYEKIKQINL